MTKNKECCGGHGATAHIAQVLNNATEMLEVYRRTKDDVVLQMVESLIDLARTLLQEEQPCSAPLPGPSLPSFPPDVRGAKPRPHIPEGVYAYMAPGIWDEGAITAGDIETTTDTTNQK